MSFFNSQTIGEVQLIFCVILFGLSFTVQRMAAVSTENNLGPVSYNACRYIFSTFLMLFVLPIMNKINSDEVSDKNEKKEEIYNTSSDSNNTYNIWFYGLICGVAGVFGSILQQVGLVYISAGKAAFITSLNVITVPMVEALINHRISHSTWIASIVSVLGTYLLSGAEGGSHGASLNELFGEELVLLSVVFWTIAIISSDRGCKSCDCISLTAVEFLATSVFALLAAIYYEPHEWVYPYTNIRSNLFYICCAGLTECGAFVLCSLGQMTVDSSRTALLLSLESVSGAVCGYFFLHEVLGGLELIGCLLMFLSFLLSTEEWEIADAIVWAGGLCGGERSRSNNSKDSPRIAYESDRLLEKNHDNSHNRAQFIGNAVSNPVFIQKSVPQNYGSYRFSSNESSEFV